MTEEAVSRGNKNRELSGLGWLFFISMVLHILTSLAVSILQQKGITLPVEMALVLSELSILIPSLIYILIGKLSFRDDLGFRPVKAGTFFMCILLSALVTPVATFFNVLSQLFVDNTMLRMSDSLLGGSGVIVIFLGAVYGPFCEELLFRSVINNRYSVYIGPMRAAFISAMLFALAHMNINQASYAFVLGLIFAIINRAARSVYPSLIIHICVNGSNLLFLFGVMRAQKALGIDGGSAAAGGVEKDVLFALIGITLVIALICSAIAIPCVIWISKHENNEAGLNDMFRGSHPRERWLTVPLVAGIILVLIVMFGLAPLLSALRVTS